MRIPLRTTVRRAGLLAGLGLLAACNPMENSGSIGTSSATMTAPVRAGAQPAGTTASGENAQTNQTVGGPNAINRPYYLGADPNFPRGISSGSRGGP
jgi:hypothetical protein